MGNIGCKRRAKKGKKDPIRFYSGPNLQILLREQARPDLSIFVIRAHGCIHHISLARIRDSFVVVRTLVTVIRGMALKRMLSF